NPSFRQVCGRGYAAGARLQSHARAIRHSDSPIWRGLEPSQNSYNPTLGQSVIPTHVAIFYKISADSYNPTLGQSVIPTVIVCMAVCTSAMLQSHARAIRH